MSETLAAVYELPGPLADAKRLAEMIAFEETVEVPLNFPLPPRIREGIVGRVVDIRPAVGEKRFSAVIEFPAALALGGLGTALNLVFGNASIWPGVRLVDVRWPQSLLASLPGPSHGTVGVRHLTGVRGRPLLATALKPMGSSDEELAAAAVAFARGGGDIAKDDQNIVDASMEKFRQRISRIGEAVAAENARGGTRCLYLPHLAGPDEELEKRLDFVLGLGLAGVLVCPAILGLDRTRRLAASRPALIMAHPAFSGAFFSSRAHGIEASLYLGNFARLLGADISVFPNSGGRFGLTAEECRATATRGREELGALRPLLPAPGGGMKLEDAPRLAADFGVDAVWLVGGSLLMQAGGPEVGARAFRAEIEKSFGAGVN